MKSVIFALIFATGLQAFSQENSGGGFSNIPSFSWSLSAFVDSQQADSKLEICIKELDAAEDKVLSKGYFIVSKSPCEKVESEYRKGEYNVFGNFKFLMKNI